MRPILSATDTYNYTLAKWLEEKLKLLSNNEYTINDIFSFSEEIRAFPMKEDDLLVSYDVSALFTNVPLKETIDILVEKAFNNNWFNVTHNLDLQKHELAKLLEISTTNQLFQFNGQLYEQVDGVAMGSPLGPLMANAFMCHLEEKLTRDAVEFPDLYRRYVDDTIVVMPDVNTAEDFLSTLNNLHSSLCFTMELPVDNTIPFLGMDIIQNGTKLETRVYRKPTNTGLLLHYNSHVDARYINCLLKTMVHRAQALSSTPELFYQECDKLRSIFTRLNYPLDVINSAINKSVITSRNQSPPDKSGYNNNQVVRVSLPFKDQRSADTVNRQMNDLSNKIGVQLQPVFTSRKLEQVLMPKERKPTIINQHCVVYKFKCGLCDADYVGFTTRHLFQRINEHKFKSSSIGKHFKDQHGGLDDFNARTFQVLKKCKNKWDCLVYEMLFIKNIKPSLNVQTDSIRAKLFI